MVKAEKQFRLSALLAIFVLLTVLLAVINCVSLTMAAADADELTQRIAERNGVLTGTADSSSGEPSQDPFREPWRRPWQVFGPMGPTSPDLDSSLRYFTASFTPEGEPVGMVAYSISALTEEEAMTLARSLLGKTAGWKNNIYRYLVYECRGLTYVTVIDQGRELVTAYRILLISLIGEVLCLVISWFVLAAVGRRLFAPLEEADRKQKQFISAANMEFRLPITVIGAETELLEKEHGPDDRTRSIRRQLKKMDDLTGRLESLTIYEEADTAKEDVSLSAMLQTQMEIADERFVEKGLTLRSDIEPDVMIEAYPEAMKRMVNELIDNAILYSVTGASFRLRRESERIILTTENDTDLRDGEYDQVFDRFTTLENAVEGAVGLGLSTVKEIVKKHDGRATAWVKGGVFTVRITL